MKIQLIVITLLLTLCTVAQASIINYTMTDGGTTWNGSFDVANTFDQVLLVPNYNLNGMTLNGNTSGVTGVNNLGGNQLQWGTGAFNLALTTTTLGPDRNLYDDVITNFFSWNDILSVSPTYNFDSASITGTGASTLGAGSVTFSEAVSTPEPGTIMLLGSGLLAFGMNRFRRRKENIA